MLFLLGIVTEETRKNSCVQLKQKKRYKNADVIG